MNIHCFAEEAGPAPGKKREEPKQARKGKELFRSLALLSVNMRFSKHAVQSIEIARTEKSFYQINIR